MLLLAMLAGAAPLAAQNFWVQVTQPSSNPVDFLLVHPSNRLFAASRQGGAWYSENRGDSWTMSGFASTTLTGFDANPFSGRMHASAGNGYFISTNNGTTWQSPVNEPLNYHSVHTFAFRSAQVNYAGTQQMNPTLPPYLYKTLNGGTGWMSRYVGKGTINGLVINPTNGHLFLAVLNDGMLRTIDETTYVYINAGLTSNNFSRLIVNTRGQLFLGTSDAGAFRSTNNGATWTPIIAGLGSNTVRDLVVNELFVLYAATDAGVYQSTNNGGQWTPLSSGLSTTRITSLAIDDDGYLYAGAANGAVFRSNGSTEASFAAQQSVSFGDVPVNQQGTYPLTVRNAGTKALDISSVVSSNPAFTVAPSSAVIPAGGSSDFQLTFAPQRSGPDYTRFFFSHNGQASPDTVSASGNGIAPEFTATPPFLLFGDVPVGEQRSKDVRVSNTGNAPLRILSAASDNGAFSVTPMSAYILPSQYQDFTVTFDARDARQYVGNIVFTDNTHAGSNSVQISGTGSTADILLAGTQVDFGDVPLGATGRDSILITSSGTVPLVITSVDSDNPAFRGDVDPAPLQPGAKTFVRMTFTPGTRGQAQGAITLRHNGGTRESRISVDGIGVSPAFTVNPARIDFGQVTLGSVRRDSVLVRNTGNAALSIQTAATAAPFSVQPANALLQPQETAVFFVSYSPAAVGAQNGLLLFTHSADTSPDTVTLAGTGTAQQAASFKAEPRALDFADVPVNGTATRNVTVRNPGTAPLDITTITAFPAQFSVSPGPTAIPPGGTVVFTVTFAPTVIGTRQGGVVFVHNGQPARDTVTVRGNGAAASRPGFALLPQDLAFGNVAVGDTAIDSARVTNTGNALLRITSVNSSNAAFAVSPTNAQIDSGESRFLRVRFIPPTTGLHSANLVIFHNGSTSPDTLQVGGRGTDPLAPIFSTAAASVQFDSVEIGSADTAGVLVSNLGNAPLVISSVTSDTAVFTVLPVSATIPTGGSRRFVVQFAPTAVGMQAGLLSFTHNGTPPLDKILVSGTGVTPGGGKAVCIVTPDVIDFGFIELGRDTVETVTVRNPGTEDLRINAITVSNTIFSVAPDPPVTVRPGDSTVFTIRFAPRNTENETGVVEFHHNAQGGNTRLWLSGAGFSQGLVLSTRRIDFGGVELGSAASDTIIVRNANEFPAMITRIVSDDAQFSLSPTSATIETFDERRFVLRFTPSSLGAQAARLRLIGTADDTLAVIESTGTGLAGAVQAVVGDGRAGADIPVTVQVQPGFPTNTSVLYYRSAGATVYTPLALQPAGSALAATIPGTGVGLRGVEYYVEIASSAGDTLYFPATEPQTRPALIRVSIPGAQYPHAMRGDSYRMVSVPAELAESALPAVFTDDLGRYNRRMWRLFHWESGDYREYEDIRSVMQPGTALWLVTYNGMSFDVDAALSVDTRAPQQFVLEPGWNQLAGHFAFSVAWADVIAESRADNSVISQPYFFDGEQYVPGRQALQSWDGYFVYNDTPGSVTLTVPPVEAPPGLIKSAEQKPLTADATLAMQITAAFPVTGRSDRHNFVGFVPRNGARRNINVLEPPLPDRLGRISIDDDGTAVMEKFREDAGHGAAWDLRVEAPAGESSADLMLQPDAALPRGYAMYLFDLDAGRAVPVEQGLARVDVRAGTRRLRLVLGTEEDARRLADGISPQPLVLALIDAAPNPSSETTMIRYTVDARSTVTVDVHDALGRHVRTLAHTEQVAGVYSVLWDGRDARGRLCSEGVYHVSVAADGRIVTRSLLRIAK